jgi:hypothetical protein
MMILLGWMLGCYDAGTVGDAAASYDTADPTPEAAGAGMDAE